MMETAPSVVQVVLQKPPVTIAKVPMCKRKFALCHICSNAGAAQVIPGHHTVHLLFSVAKLPYCK